MPYVIKRVLSKYLQLCIYANYKAPECIREKQNVLNAGVIFHCASTRNITRHTEIREGQTSEEIVERGQCRVTIQSKQSK